MNLPAGFAAPTAYEWADDSRMDRIEAVLGANAKVSLADSMALQIDETSMLARRATAMLANVTGETPDQKAALAMLRAWNGVIAADSAAAALFEIWQSRHLAPAAVAAIVPAAARPAFVRADPNAVIDVLEARHPMLGGDANRAAILKTSLAAAWVDATALMGPEPATWKWGSLHQARWSPALALPGRAAEQMVGPLPVGGAGSTPRAGSHRGTDLTLAHGASVRMVIDVGAWDNSVVINTPGQSGDLASPHYRDLFPLWAAGKYVPMLWSRPRVLAEAESIIRAVPAR